MTIRTMQQKTNTTIINCHKDHIDMYRFNDIPAMILTIAEHAYNSMAWKKRQKSDILNKMSETFTKDQQKHGLSVEDIKATANLEAWQSYVNNGKLPLPLIDGTVFKQTRSKLNTMVISIQRRIVSDANIEGELQGKLSIAYKPVSAHSDTLKRDKMKYILSRMKPEEVKLIKCYIYFKDKVNGDKVQSEATVADIRKYMEYGDTVRRKTIWKRMKKAKEAFKHYWKSYDIDGYNGIHSMQDYDKMIVYIDENGNKAIKRNK